MLSVFIFCLFIPPSVFSINEKGCPLTKERNSHSPNVILDSELTFLAKLSDQDAFKEMVRKILVPRVPGSPGHEEVKKYITAKLDSCGWTVMNHDCDDDTPHGKKTFTNIIATYNPTASRRLVIACHYDSKMIPKGFLGATDSAVPCVMMLELACLMKDRLKQSKMYNDVTLQLIFFDGEEAFDEWTETDSLYGSRCLAKKLANTPCPQSVEGANSEIDRIDLFMLLDLIGTKECQFYSFFENTQKWYDRLLAIEKQMFDLEMVAKDSFNTFSSARKHGTGIGDDHVPFLSRGVPIVHLISYPFPRVWHKISDNYSALDFDVINKLNVILRAFVKEYLHLELQLDQK